MLGISSFGKSLSLCDLRELRSSVCPLRRRDTDHHRDTERTVKVQRGSRGLGLLFVIALFGFPLLSVHAQTTPVRPRMLIGEKDPLTGFSTLRERYTAGSRPSQAIDGLALSYLLTHDEAFARRAVDEMRRSHPPELVGSRTYPEYVKWSLAFDWLYSYPGFDAALKD